MNNWKDSWDEYLESKELLKEIEEAKERGKQETQQGLSIKSVHYDESSDYIIIHFSNDTVFMFPPSKVKGLSGTSQQLNDIWIPNNRLSIHWESLDIQLDIKELLKGNFGKSRL